MLKKLFIFGVSLLSLLAPFYLVSAEDTKVPTVNCIWLPGCPSESIDTPAEYNAENNVGFQWLANLIAIWIQYVAVVAVISLMLSWILYLVSGWEEEKVKKARLWITYSLIGVFISISAWGIINVLNSLVIS